MKAVCWNGVNDIRVERVADAKRLNDRDAILKVKLSSVCGSDLHLMDGYIPTMKPGDIIGHEFMGEVIEVGPQVKALKVGDRVMVPSFIGCGGCHYCLQDDMQLCDNTNVEPQYTRHLYGKVPGGIYGYSHAFGGYAGSHAEYVRVPFADHNAFVVPEGVRDDQAVFASDAVPTGYFAADMCDIKPGDVVAVWGCGGVGQMAIRSAYLLGASRVIAIDRFPERLQMARERSRAEVLNYMEVDILEALEAMTGGRGPDACIDAVGTEAHGTSWDYYLDRAKVMARLGTDQAPVLRQAILACRKGGVVSVVGVYGGLVDKFPMGAVINKGLRLRAGQQPGQKYAHRIFDHILKGELDPSDLLTHKLPLDDGARGYQLFKQKAEGCVRVVFAP